ncbi:MAG: hypothetical protein QXQ94_11080, partial [Candidatus Bathyarchaeia archaeon]
MPCLYCFLVAEVFFSLASIMEFHETLLLREDVTVIYMIVGFHKISRKIAYYFYIHSKVSSA